MNGYTYVIGAYVVGLGLLAGYAIGLWHASRLATLRGKSDGRAGRGD